MSSSFVESAARRVDTSAARLRVDISGREPKCTAKRNVCLVEPVGGDEERAVPRQRPRLLLGYRRARLDRELHGIERRSRPAEKLSCSRDTGVRADTRAHSRKAVVRAKSVTVIPDRDQGIAERAERDGVLRLESQRTAGERDRRPEAMLRHRELREPRDGERIVSVRRERATQGVLRAREPGRVGGLARKLLVTQTEQRERARIVWPGRDGTFEPPDDRAARAGRELLDEL
jgi:hypothetical protein